MLRDLYKIRVLRKGQAAMEYMLLLGVVVAIVLVAFKTHLAQRVPVSADKFFKATTIGIMGKQNPCGDGNCVAPYEDPIKCCVDCGGC